MQNTTERFENSGRPELPVDYFLVVTQLELWYVSRDMAQAIEASLSESPVPEWITFVDLTGARVRVRARRIECIYQCTASAPPSSGRWRAPSSGLVRPSARRRRGGTRMSEREGSFAQ